MARVTITLSDDLYRTLKVTAARRGLTLGEVIESNLRAFGAQSKESAADLLLRAREQSQLDEEAALDIAVQETHRHRRDRASATAKP